MKPALHLGVTRPLDGRADLSTLQLPAHHFVTHCVAVGMTGSGKTGLVTVMIEEAARNQIPVLVIDVKGDLPNLLLQFPSLGPEVLMPWVEGATQEEDTTAYAARLAEERRVGLASYGITALKTTTGVRWLAPSEPARLLHGVPIRLASIQVNGSEAGPSLQVTELGLDVIRPIRLQSPAPRSEFGAVLSATRGQLLVMGGTLESGGLAGDVWRYGIADDTWTLVSTDGGIAAHLPRRDRPDRTTAGYPGDGCVGDLSVDLASPNTFFESGIFVLRQAGWTRNVAVGVADGMYWNVPGRRALPMSSVEVPNCPRDAARPCSLPPPERGRNRSP